ncbi:MAG: sulfopyruvate decarboxylase subunit alpha [Nitrospirae bacterium]|nr:MAG: sulfopyruvate decarboxylase subunit alpha [Nitrospirota bacterium]
MIESDAFIQALQDIGVDFFTGVPDSILAGIIAELMERRLYTPAVREDEAVAMAAGAYMSGKIPAVLMQNSGLGTSLNTLISLNMIYCQPCILIVSWRGYQGRTLSEKTAIDDLKWLAETFMKQRIPVALLITKGVVKGLHP